MNLLIDRLVGFGVGTLVGTTGLGGGGLLLPILIFGRGWPPIRAVGSDAFLNFITKIDASMVHLRKGLLANGPFLKDQLLALVEPHIRVAEQAR
jgi:uncharacterized membrane protein YfcA